MARKFVTPVYDASIYEEFQERNTGFDEIIEIGKSVDGTKAIRGLILFDEEEFSNIPWSSAEFYLNLRVARGNNFQGSQMINFYEVSQSWQEGTGYYVQDFTNPEDGVSWKYRFNLGNTDVSESYIGGVTQSYTASADVWGSAFDPKYGGVTGSVGYTGSGFIDAWGFGWKPADVRLDVTELVRDWISGSRVNNGMLVKLADSEEQNENVKANVKFFSRQTHTIFPPTLEAVWNSQTIATSGSGLFEAPAECELFVTNMRRSFVTGSTYRIRFGARPTIPIKTFDDTFRYGNKYFLPSGSYIGVVDVATSAYVVPFDTGSLISADTTSSYYDLKIENMYLNRTYKLQVMVSKPWGPEVIDTNQNFKVVLWHK